MPKHAFKIRILWILLALIAVGLASVQAQDTTPTPLPAFPLAAGIPVEGNINNLTPGTNFSFEGRIDDMVTLRMEATSGDLDPFLVLISPQGTILEENDDEQDGARDAAIEVTLPENGIYIVRATRFLQENGISAGTYRLTLEIQGLDKPGAPLDPLSQSPEFSVPFTQLDYQEFGTGTLSEETPRRYFAVGGNAGDLMRAIVTVTEGDIASPTINILGSDLNSISETISLRENEYIAFTTLPGRDWYLIEVASDLGEGAFTLFVDGLAGQFIEYNSNSLRGTFTQNTPSASYTFDGKIGDQIFISVATLSGNISPQVRLLDITQRELGQASGSRFTNLQVTLSRSGTYILQVNNTQEGNEGIYSMRLNAVEVDLSKLEILEADYNNAYKGEIDDNNPGDFYLLSGKAGDLITAQMTSSEGSSLDPFLLVMDADLNELVANDNIGNTRNARIAQFALPQDGDYYLLAGRSALRFGSSYGSYDLTLNAGSIALEGGSLTTTVNWTGDDDINLFIREPSGRIISWSNPEPTESGTLQIDSNTNCETISTQAVEHIYWDEANFPENGDYQVWVWYQNTCGEPNPVNFTLVLKNVDNVLLEKQQELLPGERFNVDLRISESQIFLLNNGNLSQPSAQQRASEGGDIPITYNQGLTGSIDDQVYSRFYQFEGEQGDEIVIEARTITGNLDPVLVLRNDREQNLAVNDDGQPDERNARIELTLEESGRYVIAVTRFGVREGTTRGDYRLNLSVK